MCFHSVCFDVSITCCFCRLYKKEEKKVSLENILKEIPEKDKKDFVKLKNYWELKRQKENPFLVSDMNDFYNNLIDYTKGTKKLRNFSIHRLEKVGWLFPIDVSSQESINDKRTNSPCLDKRVSKIVKEDRKHTVAHERIFELFLESIGFVVEINDGRCLHKTSNETIENSLRENYFGHFFSDNRSGKYVGNIVRVSIFRFLMFMSRNYSTQLASEFLFLFEREVKRHEIEDEEEVLELWRKAVHEKDE